MDHLELSDLTTVGQVSSFEFNTPTVYKNADGWVIQRSPRLLASPVPEESSGVILGKNWVEKTPVRRSKCLLSPDRARRRLLPRSPPQSPQGTTMSPSFTGSIPMDLSGIKVITTPLTGSLNMEEIEPNVPSLPSPTSTLGELKKPVIPLLQMPRCKSPSKSRSRRRTPRTHRVLLPKLVNEVIEEDGNIVEKENLVTNMETSVFPAPLTNVREVWFKTSEGLQLEGVFLEPHKQVSNEVPCIIMVHQYSFLGGSQALKFSLAKVLCFEFGYPVLTFNMRGVGESEGKKTPLLWGEVADLRAACLYVRSTYHRSVWLVGFSSGSAVVGYMVNEYPWIFGATYIGATLGCPTSLCCLVHFCRAATSRKAKLFVTASRDGCTPLWQFWLWYWFFKEPKDYFIVPGIGHFELETPVFDRGLATMIENSIWSETIPDNAGLGACSRFCPCTCGPGITILVLSAVFTFVIRGIVAAF